MRAIEIKGKTDKLGHLKIDYNLNKSERNVRVLILVEEDSYEVEEEKLWLNSISRNPAFDFLSEPSEDIYTPKDGE
ncbi:MAG: hypothetical protein Q7W54_04375, partial [Bacteroidota bacterium]|nr:hypothetical protein [Bacteroidota bacterium]